MIRLRAGVIMSMARLEQIMLEGSRVFTRAEQEECESMYLCYRAGHNRLTEASLQSRLCRWQQRPKGHMLEHCIFDHLPENPRFCHNFLGEDFIRRIKVLAIRSHPGHLSRHVLTKYCLQMCLQWK